MGLTARPLLSNSPHVGEPPGPTEVAPRPTGIIDPNTGKDFVIIDFEGESRRSLGERTLKRSPLVDVSQAPAPCSKARSARA